MKNVSNLVIVSLYRKWLQNLVITWGFVWLGFYPVGHPGVNKHVSRPGRERALPSLLSSVENTSSCKQLKAAATSLDGQVSGNLVCLAPQRV